MADNPVPENFNWVRGRAECSLFRVFKELLVGVRTDVDERNAIRQDEHTKWSVGAESDKRFSVFSEEVWEGRTHGASVEFVISEDDRLEVFDGDGKSPIFTATITLNNEGQCKLKVGDLELEQWQVRRMALERIFFVLPQHGKRVRRGDTLQTGTY